MKHPVFLLFAVMTFAVNHNTYSQTETTDEWYVTSGGELIFSWADISTTGTAGDVIPRMSAFLHLQSYANYDFGTAGGMFIGLAIRNVGFIYDDPLNSEVRKKFRSYTMGIPVALKLGNMKSRFAYLGYEFEVPIGYKEKTFVNGKRTDRFIDGFGERTPEFYHTVFVGFNGISGLSLKFKYYFTEFFNSEFTETVNGVTTQPYADFNANLFYISLSINLFKGSDLYL